MTETQESCVIMQPIARNKPDSSYMRTCNTCSYEGPADDFTIVAKRKDGGPMYRGTCKPCTNKYYREYRAANRPARRASKYKAKYGISLDEYEAMADAQGRMCAICGAHESTQLWGRLYVDHNHVTNAIRGLLCNTCNTGIGYMYGDKGAAVLRAAVTYIEVNEGAR